MNFNTCWCLQCGREAILPHYCSSHHAIGFAYVNPYVQLAPSAPPFEYVHLVPSAAPPAYINLVPSAPPFESVHFVPSAPPFESVHLVPSASPFEYVPSELTSLCLKWCPIHNQTMRHVLSKNGVYTCVDAASHDYKERQTRYLNLIANK